VEHWKNPDIERYEPQKILIVGLTSKKEAREKFENQLKKELEKRGNTSVTSLDFFSSIAQTGKMTEAQLKIMENTLLEQGFDTILLSKIIGVENKIQYKENYNNYEETYRKFVDEYLMYQDIYYNPDYYDAYTVYHSETSMYCICPTKERELLWKGYIDIIDPASIDGSVTDFVYLAIAVMEHEQLIRTEAVPEVTPEKELIN
jgi:hypothetical protein